MSVVHIPDEFREAALKAANSRMRSPLHPLGDHDIDEIARDLVSDQSASAMLANCVRAVIDDWANAILGRPLYLVEDD